MSAVDYYLLKKNVLDEARVLLANYLDVSRGLHKLGAPSITQLSASGKCGATPMFIRIWNNEGSEASDIALWALDPAPQKAVYIKANVRFTKILCIGVSDDTLNNRYRILIDIGLSAADFKLNKVVNGTGTDLATEAVDLEADTFYLVEFLWDMEHGLLTVWRDGALKFHVIDTDLKNLSYFYLDQRSAGGYGEISYPFVLAWE